MFNKQLQQPCNCENKNYKVVFMDVQMPVMDGITSARKITQLTCDSETTSIFAVTAYTDQNTKSECLAAGMKGVYNKPMQFKDVHRIMWLHHHRVGHEEYQDIFIEQFRMSSALINEKN